MTKMIDFPSCTFLALSKVIFHCKLTSHNFSSLLSALNGVFTKGNFTKPIYSTKQAPYFHNCACCVVRWQPEICKLRGLQPESTICKAKVHVSLPKVVIIVVTWMNGHVKQQAPRIQTFVRCEIIMKLDCLTLDQETWTNCIYWSWPMPKSCQEYNKQFLGTGSLRDLGNKNAYLLQDFQVCSFLHNVSTHGFFGVSFHRLRPHIVRCYLELEER